MDDFYREINVILYLKWIIYQGEKYDLSIRFENENQDSIIIENDKVVGRVVYYRNGIFEEILIDRCTGEKIFYLHFQFNHFNYAIDLFKEMINCALSITRQQQRRILLCCSGGLTTTLFAKKMLELAALKNLSYEISAIGYTNLYKVASEYDIILLAPQIGYLLPQVKRCLKDKKIIMIPTQIFATSNFSSALKIIEDLYREKGSS